MAFKLLFSTQNGLLKTGILLAVFAVFDTVFTDFGIRHEHIEEANPVMRFVYDTSIFGFYLTKISLPLLLIFFITKVKPKPYFRLLIGSTVLLYFVVLCKHAFWLTLVAKIS